MIQRIIPSSGKHIPAIGLGTWQSFDVSDKSLYPQLNKVLDEMQIVGALLIDSSPMYGNSEKVIGDLTAQRKDQDSFFYATKVWTSGREQGIRQMETSLLKMQRKVIDLMQIHNLCDWKTQLPVLREWKEKGIIKYIGITHYADNMHAELESVLLKEKLDFVQFNYSIDSTHADKRLFSVAGEKGVATLINRPFGEGKLFEKVKNKRLPLWANELGIDTWASFFLKFILANPAVTCIIPATSNSHHAMQNFSAGIAELPDEKIRNKMRTYFLEN